MKDLEESKRWWQRPKRKVDFVRLSTILQRAEHLGRCEDCQACEGTGRYEDEDGVRQECWACDGTGVFVPLMNATFLEWVEADLP